MSSQHMGALPARCSEARANNFNAHCPGNIHWNKKVLCTCIQRSRKIRSSQFPPFRARVVARSLGVQLGKRMLSPAPNKGASSTQWVARVDLRGGACVRRPIHTHTRAQHATHNAQHNTTQAHRGRFRTARAQRGHSANYYGDYPGNNPENHPLAESCTINSKLKNSNI